MFLDKVAGEGWIERVRKAGKRGRGKMDRKSTERRIERLGKDG